MSNSAPLLPTLQALLPPSHLQPLLTSLSLRSLHSTKHRHTDAIYINSQPVVPGQQRHLRLRSISHKPKDKQTKTEIEITGEQDEEEERYSLSYISMPLQGREYAGMDVRACLGVEVEGYTGSEEIDEFITLLGFQKSHSFTLSGYRFHLAIPLPSSSPITLHLTVARLLESTAGGQQQSSPEKTSEPYLVQLQPSRPVPAVGSLGVIGLQDMMRVMQEVAARIDGVDWSTRKT
ncbi:hypothetical protein BCR39DRAFT_333345 [Naematelia encephala]|uniref:Mediator of RNA polymerase II transcription subunit 18 n=1 Tax=Naematelia encephala TaxID=71784 RepID=A0A1Y2BEK9_9TREE|nr:hypothetical protein BCR39DRAFT_333345 [Naematelia encephala]